jgi:hypothetical protein
MLKRAATPLAKDRLLPRNSSNAGKPFRDIKNVQAKPSLSRNSSSSRLMVGLAVTEPIRCNPESAERKRNKNRQITDEMRKVVVEWMLEVSHRSKMRRETVFMAVKLLDAGLEKLPDVGPANVQLLAVASLFMSAKYEEIYPENLNKFLDYTLHSYQKTEMLSMEEKVLSLMNFKLTFETRYTHAGMLIEKELSYGPNARKLKSLIVFLLEISLYGQWEELNEQELG